jgi:hypothetical protein
MMTIAAPAHDRAILDGAAPPSRPCATCGKRTGWHRERSGGWACRTCARLPKTVDDPGDPAVLRHQCDKLGCQLDGEDTEVERSSMSESPPPAATIAVSGPSLLRCPGCRRWRRELLVGADGRLWCARCPGFGVS